MLVDLTQKKSATPQTLYRIPSHTKLFTATVIMKLYSQGKLSTDNKVNAYLPWFKSNTNKTLDDIRIRHLLSHTSGISRDGNFGHWSTDEFPTNEQIQSMLDQDFSIFQPSERLKYSNIAYALLRTIIRRSAAIIMKPKFKNY